MSKIVSTYELNAMIGKKAAEDEEFRMGLLSDPKGMLEKALNVTFPDSIKFEVHVETGDTLHLIVPAKNAQELTDEQLEQVAGGKSSMGTPIDPGGCMAYGVPGGWELPVEGERELPDPTSGGW